MAIGIIDMGSHVPDHVVTNDDICAWSGATHDWITNLTGINERRYAEPEQTTSDLAVLAAAPLVADPSVQERLAWLFLSTNSPDQPSPATAAVVQAKLGLPALPAFDVGVACAGVIFHMALANALMRDDDRQVALAIGADKVSSIVDRTDRRTVALFGDGAAALLLGSVPDGYGIRSTSLLTDGARWENIGIYAGGSRLPLTPERYAEGGQFTRMDGRAVAAFVLQTLPKVIDSALEKAGVGLHDIDRFVFHQANGRLLAGLGKKLGIDPDRVPTTVSRFGNSGVASLPVTLVQAHRERPFQRGETLLLAAVGAGMTAGAAVVTWY
ncbi:3-oxoacyl-ACP synthase III family protein [Micromonospora arborensis]|uniref:3-oxoacyl-ACP synthase III family protein n=1 Tax=Micromonospora arborensis TaxID=2116518 RepID=UPI003713E25A